MKLDDPAEIAATRLSINKRHPINRVFEKLNQTVSTIDIDHSTGAITIAH